MEQLTIIPIVLSSADLVLNVLHKAVNLPTPNEYMSRNISQDKNAFNTTHSSRVSPFY